MTENKKSIFRQFPMTFWSGNVMEIFERMSWYGFYCLSSLYITGAVSDGGLGFSSEDRGLIQGVVTFFVYLFPFFTGALGDRYGYKKMLIISYCILSPAYFLLGQMKTFPTFFMAFMLVGIGASIFKPFIVSTIAKTTNDKTSSLGFGIFYMMVNIGGFAGPFIAGAIRNAGWNYIFIASSIWIALNIPIIFLFYKEPSKEAKGTVPQRSFMQVMKDMFSVLGNARFFVTVFVSLVIFVMGSKWLSMGQVFLYFGIWVVLNLIFDIIFRVSRKNDLCMRIGNGRFLLFLLLLSSFWVAFNQIFLTLPEYIRDFTDSRPFVTGILAFLSDIGLSTGVVEFIREIFVKPDGTIKPEQIVNLNPLSIIFFQLFISYIVTRIKPLFTIIGGIAVTAITFFMLIMGFNPVIVIIGVLIFSFGEMLASPKAKEYTARYVAPPDKVALYMGYYLWCNALGNLFGGIFSGNMYGWLARDMQRPDLMWIFFASFSIVCALLLFVYHKTIGVKIDAEHKKIEAAREAEETA